jgi:hypothetical protein
MPVFLSIVNMVGPNPRTMALMTTNSPESSEKTRDHSKFNREDVSLPTFWGFEMKLFLPAQCLMNLGRQWVDAQQQRVYCRPRYVSTTES